MLCVANSLSAVKLLVLCSNGCMLFLVPSSTRPAGPASPPVREDDNSQVQDREQSQQYPLGSRETESSAELWASDNKEEPRDNNEYVTDGESLQSVISDIW